MKITTQEGTVYYSIRWAMVNELCNKIDDDYCEQSCPIDNLCPPMFPEDAKYICDLLGWKFEE